MSSQWSNWRDRLHANPSRMEQDLAIKLQENGIRYQTQVEIAVTIADFYLPLESRPLLAFVDGRVHFGTAQMSKDEELRTLLLKRGYRILKTILRELLGQEKRPTVRRNPEQPRQVRYLGRGSRLEDLKGSQRGPLRERGLTHSAQSEWSLVRAQWVKSLRK